MIVGFYVLVIIIIVRILVVLVFFGSEWFIGSGCRADFVLF